VLTLRRIVFGLAVAVVALLAAVFAYTNPDPIDVDVGFRRFEGVSMATVVASVFAGGWLCGLLSAGIALWRSASEKRRLRHDLQYAETELRTLRKLP
jgi:hypothetical protein